MRTDPSFLFYLSVSRQAFAAKPDSKDKRISKLLFERRLLTVDSLLQYVLEGKSFCYNFATHNPDGVITMEDKRKEYFLSTSTIIFDVDDYDISMTECIESLRNKPTLAYASFRDGKDGLHRFRLVYVLEEIVSGEAEFTLLYHAIATANGLVKKEKGKNGGLDVLSVAQFYYGTFSTASVYKSGIIYCKDDFKQFVMDATNQCTTDFSSTQTQNDNHFSVPVITTGSAKSDACIDSEFLYDFKYLPKDVFFSKYWHVYHQNYELSLHTPLLPDPSCMFSRYPDDYVYVRHKRKGKETLKWVDGERRRKKLYISGHIMRYNLPSLSIENLLFNLALERQWYYDNSDNQISDDVLIRDAINAFTKSVTLEPSKHPEFSVNKKYWAERGITPNKAKWIVARYLKVQKVERLFNPSLTREENLSILKENGITDKMLERMVTNGEIKIDIAERMGPHAYLSCCPDSVTIRIIQLIELNERITQPEIAAELNVDPRTVKRHMDKMKGVYIERIGNNRTGTWKILPAYQDYAVFKKVDNATVTEDCSTTAENVNKMPQNFSGPCLASWETSQYNPAEHAAETQNIMDCDGCKIIADGAEQNHEQVFLRQAPTPLIIESIVRRTG